MARGSSSTLAARRDRALASGGATTSSSGSDALIKPQHAGTAGGVLLSAAALACLFCRPRAALSRTPRRPRTPQQTQQGYTNFAFYNAKGIKMLLVKKLVEVALFITGVRLSRRRRPPRRRRGDTLRVADPRGREALLHQRMQLKGLTRKQQTQTPQSTTQQQNKIRPHALAARDVQRGRQAHRRRAAARAHLLARVSGVDEREG